MEQFVDDLADYQKAFLKKYPYPQIFAVISWGCAATAWLATVLNRHPDIYCVHATNQFWHVLGECEKLDGVPYLRVLGSQGHAHLAAGEVHGVSRHLVPECRRSFGEKFNAVVVVREPISRVFSQMALYEDFGDPQFWGLNYLEPILSRTRITVNPVDHESRFFVHAANMLNAILEEPAVGKIYRSEDLTSDTTSLGNFVDEITRGMVSPSSDWLESAIQTARVNVHAARHPRRELSDWQIDVIGKVVDPRAWEIYESLGYARPDFLSVTAANRLAVVGPTSVAKLFNVEGCNPPDGVPGAIQGSHF